MVNYEAVSVGFLVEPDTLWRWRNKNRRKGLRGNEKGSLVDNPAVKIGFEYRTDMTDFAFNVMDLKDQETETEQDEAKPVRVLKRVDNEGRPVNRKSRSQARAESVDSEDLRPRNVLQKSSSQSMKSCDFYRQKILQEGIQDVQRSQEYADWLKFDSMNAKTAGQKVVSKLAAQQKALEAEAANQKKKQYGNRSSGSGGSDSDQSAKSVSELLPPRKRPNRLDPLPVEVRISVDGGPARLMMVK